MSARSLPKHPAERSAHQKKKITSEHSLYKLQQNGEHPRRQSDDLQERIAASFTFRSENKGDVVLGNRRL